MKFDLRSPRYRHWLWALYLPLYLAAFFLVEHYISSDAPYWVSYWPLVDDAIPFCPPFVLAYYLWFPYMVLTGLYLAFRYPDCFRRYMHTIAMGFSFCILFFFILPNGQDLRPASFSEDNLFTWMIGLIYAADTNTNVLPSVHAYGSMVVVPRLQTLAAWPLYPAGRADLRVHTVHQAAFHSRYYCWSFAGGSCILFSIRAGRPQKSAGRGESAVKV
mgnify:CR=1 FL=1